MSKIIETRTAIQSLLTGLDCPVYYSQAPEGAALDYIVYSVDVVSRLDAVDLCELEINVVGRGRDTSAIENRCDAIEDTLDHKVVLNDDVGFQLYLERRQNVEEPDRTVVRRRMVFNFNLYERK